MAQEELAHIDIWCNEDGCDTAGYVAKELEKIFHSDHIFKHDAATLTQPSGYSKLNGTVVIVITQQTINQLVDNSAFTFANLKTQKVKRYYVDEDELLTDRNNRFQCFGGKAWTKVDINMKDKLASRLAEIVLHTLEQTGTTDSLGELPEIGTSSGHNPPLPVRRKKSVPDVVFPANVTEQNDPITNGTTKPKKGRGAFKIIPSTFCAGARESNTGTIIICTENIKWKFQGANVMAYLEEPKSRKQTQLVLEEEVKGRAYSFTLPDDLKPASYMLYVRDEVEVGAGGSLGNRKLRLLTRLTYVSDNLFDEPSLLDWCNVEDMESEENRKIADVKLSTFVDKFQLPILLPYSLNKENPTLMHVACRYGLSTLCSKILDSSCHPDNINIKDSADKYPCDIARDNGHYLLAEAFSNQVTLADLYVKCTRPEDSYSPAPNFEGNIKDIYVWNADVVDEAEGEDQPLYGLAHDHIPGSATLKRQNHTHSSVKVHSSEPMSDPARQSHTIPRSMNLNGYMNHQDVDSGDDKPRDMENIAKKIRSIRLTASNLEKRIELQKEVVQSMGHSTEIPEYSNNIEPTPKPRSSRPIVAPRKPSNSQPPTVQQRQALQTVNRNPPQTPRKPAQYTPQTQPTPETTSQDMSSAEDEDPDYLIPFATIPATESDMHPQPRNSDVPPYVPPRNVTR